MSKLDYIHSPSGAELPDSFISLESDHILPAVPPSDGITQSNPLASLNLGDAAFALEQFEQTTAIDKAYAAMNGGALSALDSRLSALYYEHSSQALAMSPFTNLVSQLQGSIVEQNGEQYVTINTVAKDGDGAKLLHQLEAIGLTQGGSYGVEASGYVPIESLAKLAALGDLSHATESGMVTNAGLVTTEADVAMDSYAARDDFGVDGSGLKVGILSDSFNTNAADQYPNGSPDTMADDIASGDLPTATKILKDSTGEDEGRGMAQLVHDIAPGAAIDFDTANGGDATFAAHILALANAGCKIIVDDISYLDEPAYQNGVIAQAIEQVTQQGVIYLSAAANEGNQGFEAAYAASGVTGAAAELNEPFAKLSPTGNKQFLAVTVQAGQTVSLVVQWDQPAASAGGAACANNLDAWLLNSGGTSLLAMDDNDNTGGDPVAVIQYTNSKTSAQTYQLAVGLKSGVAPTDLKIIAFNGTLATNSLNYNDGTIFGHQADPADIAVGAAAYFQTPAFTGTPTPTLETFSSIGPTYIYFDNAGNRLATPIRVDGPRFTSVDGGDTTFFGQDIGDDPNHYPNFFGTSAAAPDAAAVVALMVQANGALNSTDAMNLIQDSAIDMGTAGFDDQSGAGLIQADKAVQAASTGIIIGDNHHTVLNGTHLDDTFALGPNFKATDAIDGLGGTNTIILNGNYTTGVNLGADTIANIGKFVLDAGHSYKLTFHTGNVAAGQTLTIDGSSLGASDKMTITASGDAQGAYNILGGAGAD
ncbi:MAG TPA: S8 family serine peptidase, partial [Rhizomicrobium sp.]|nr:S8 family serine peptidase [Rhizomicrobium sp.]